MYCHACDGSDTRLGTPSAGWTVTRRELLGRSGVAIAGLLSGASLAHAEKADSKPRLSFGILTDAHYADTDAKGSRRYRESIEKMTECVRLMNDREVDFLIELGDLKDQGRPAVEEATLEYLTVIEEVYGHFRGPRYHVLGNHDVDSISKEQFLDRVENTGVTSGAGFYSFDSKGFHLVVLDANFTADGSDYDHGNFNWTDSNIAAQQLDWLRRDLASSAKPVIAFIHQQLDGKGSHCVRNSAEVRQVLQGNGRVLAVFQGHNHAGAHSHIENIHYYTLRAMVEGAGEQNNSYAVVDVHADNSIVVTGYRRALSQKMRRGPAGLPGGESAK